MTSELAKAHGRRHSPDAVLARNVRALRRSFDDGTDTELSQRELADRMRALGHRWHPQTVSKIQAGDRAVTAGELVGLALVLGVTIGELLDPLTAPPRLPPSAPTQPRGWQVGRIMLDEQQASDVAHGRALLMVAFASDGQLEDLVALRASPTWPTGPGDTTEETT